MKVFLVPRFCKAPASIKPDKPPQPDFTPETIIKPELQDGKIPITRAATVVGRDPTCHVRIDHKAVSRHHLVIGLQDGLCILTDIGSTNGIYHGDKQENEFVVLDGGTFRLGWLPFCVEFEPDEKAS